jgi:NitT/TauT family transport system substrate-binding protein
MTETSFVLREGSSAALRLAFVVIVLVCISGARVQAETTKPWRHVIIEPKSDAGELLMPFKRGFADKVGLPVELISVKDDELALKAVLSGAADSYEGGPAAAILADSHGADVKVIGCTWVTVPHGIFAHDNITAMDQLRGKTIAVAAPGSFPDIFARGALAKFNIPVSEVNLASLGGDLDRYRALTAHVVDAAVVSGEVTPIAAKEGIKMLVSAKDALPEFPRMCLHVTAKTIGARPDDTAKLLAAEILGLRYAMTHKDDVVKVTQEATGFKLDDPRPAFMFDLAVEQNAIATDVSIPLDKLDWLQNQLVTVGSLSKPVDVSTIIDAKPRERALELVAKMN